MAKNRPLNAKQIEAARVLAMGGTSAEAAESSGCSGRSIRRWRTENEAFRAAMREAADEHYQTAMLKLRGLAQQAVANLARLMEHADTHAVQLSACRLVIDSARGLVESDDLEQRLAALEERSNERTGETTWQRRAA